MAVRPVEKALADILPVVELETDDFGEFRNKPRYSHRDGSPQYGHILSLFVPVIKRVIKILASTIIVVTIMMLLTINIMDHAVPIPNYNDRYSIYDIRNQLISVIFIVLM